MVSRLLDWHQPQLAYVVSVLLELIVEFSKSVSCENIEMGV